MDNSIQEEMAKLMKPGVIVRGRDWEYQDSEDESEACTRTFVQKVENGVYKNWWEVEWNHENGRKGNFDYRINVGKSNF